MRGACRCFIRCNISPVLRAMSLSLTQPRTLDQRKDWTHCGGTPVAIELDAVLDERSHLEVARRDLHVIVEPAQRHQPTP
eukprot:3844270-Rhodomonas_salina.3